VAIRDSAFIDFPFVKDAHVFVDGDNDAFYFRDGHAVVERTVFLNSLDDCIDSASSAGNRELSSLTLRHVVLSNCQHEGLALSGSKGTQRRVLLQDSLVSFTQQGVENGHTPSSHKATIERVVLRHNYVGIRNGDNYPTLDVYGRVHVVNSTFVHNRIPVLDFVEKEHRVHRNDKQNKAIVPKYLYELHNAEVSKKTGLTLLSFQGCVFPLDAEASSEDRREEFALGTSGPYSTFSPSSGLFCGTEHFSVAN
jgi:hypothetical protein